MRIYTQPTVVLVLLLNLLATVHCDSGLGTSFMDYYAVLGVELGATTKEVKQRYRQMAKENHPDLAVGEERKRDAAERMAAINAAYTTLHDPDLRASYDRLYSKVNWWAGSRKQTRDERSDWPAANFEVTPGAPVWVVAYAACPAYVRFTFGSTLASIVVCNLVWFTHLILALAFYLLHNRIRWGSSVPRRASTGSVTGVFWRLLTGVVFALTAGLPVLAVVVGVLYLDTVVLCLVPFAAYALSALGARAALPSSTVAAVLCRPLQLATDLIAKLDTRPESVLTHYGRVHVSRAEAPSLRAAEEERRSRVRERRQYLESGLVSPLGSPFPGRTPSTLLGHSQPSTPSVGLAGREQFGLSPCFRPHRN